MNITRLCCPIMFIMQSLLLPGSQKRNSDSPPQNSQTKQRKNDPDYQNNPTKNRIIWCIKTTHWASLPIDQRKKGSQRRTARKDSNRNQEKIDNFFLPPAPDKTNGKTNQDARKENYNPSHSNPPFFCKLFMQ